MGVVFVRYAGRFWPSESGWLDEYGDLPHWRYLVALLAGVSVVYAPPLIDQLQLSFGMVGLAGAWTLLAFHTQQVSRETVQAYSNSALFCARSLDRLSPLLRCWGK